MKSKATGTLSGCIIWIIVLGVLSACLLPIAMMVGGFSSASNFAMQSVGPLICPDGTTPQAYSYASTTTDEYGNTQPSTAYELHCVDKNGGIIKKDPILYAFTWIGIISMIGLGIAAVLSFALAAPAGLFISKLFNDRRKSNITDIIEPT